MTFLELTIPGDPVAKGRPRMGPNGHAYTPERTRMAEKSITDLVIGLLEGQAPLECAVDIDVEFFCATNRKTDGDNLLKLITDALNQVVYADDSQILQYRCRVHRGVGKANAKTVLKVSVLE